MAFRKGQWVKLARDLDIGGGVEKAGTVGIHMGPILETATGEWAVPPEGLDPEQLRVWEIRRDAARPQHPSLREVHLVYTEGGVRDEMRSINGSMMIVKLPYNDGETRKTVAVPEEDLIAVTSLEDIPKTRRGTMREDFVPYADAGQRTT